MITSRNLLFSLTLAVCLLASTPSQEAPAAPAGESPAVQAADAVPQPAAAPVGDANSPGGPGAVVPATPVSEEKPPAAAPVPAVVEPAPTIVPPPVLGATLAEPPKLPTELQRRLKTKVSVDFRETPIEDVLKSLAEQADIDIIKSPTVTGNVTAKLTDVSLDEAMDGILAVHGFGYVTTETVVRIMPIAQLPKPEVKLATRVYHIDYADLETLNKALKDMLTARGKIAMNTKTGHLCITDTEEQVAMLDKVVEEMDRETPQILVEAKIYDVSCSAFLDFGFDWFAGTMTVYDPATGLAVGGKTEPFVRTNFGSSISQAPKGNSGLRLGVLNDNVDIDATFRAVKDNVRTRLLANPKILVLNGREATIQIVSEIPYQELTQTSGGGNIGTTKFKNVGVTLTVTPRITRDNKVLLNLQPEFSVQTGSVAIAIPSGLTAISSAQPIVDKREAQTEALITDGQTVVIGGLRKKDVVRELTKVPLLGDIPLLGELFKFRGDKTVNSELIVFITPRIITNPELSEGDSRKLDLTESELTEPDGPPPTQECSKPEPPETQL